MECLCDILAFLTILKAVVSYSLGGERTQQIGCLFCTKKYI